MGLARLCAAATRLGVLGGPVPPPATQARVRGRLHSLARDRAAISHHYDLSNDFYRLILDPSMAYSCAYWEPWQANSTLAQAQYDKLDRICRKVGLHEQPGMWLLDVGCGWGSLSLHLGETITLLEDSGLATIAWRLYLAGGRLAFAQGRMGVGQILLARPAVSAVRCTDPVGARPR